MNNNYYVDIHILQTVPPCCVNRDDTNSPKTAMYGGVTRSRVSSQSWKHAMREYFKSEFTEDELGKRTKYLLDLLVNEIIKRQPELTFEKVEKKAKKILKDAGIPVDDKKKVSDTLTFISNGQIKALADCYFEENNSDAKKIKEDLKTALQQNPSVDMALFGRMIASDPSLNYDAAAQVAHAISTHEVHTEFDYFTAVDDCSPKDNTGAGHLGTVEFNSSTLYRYASVNVKELVKNLKDDTPDVVEKFVKAFVLSMPTGKQNTFANRTVPDLVYVTIRSDQPVNLCGAFENAVKAGKDGYVKKSEEALLAYANMIYSDFVDEPKKTYFVGGEDLNVEKTSLKNLLADLKEDIVEFVNETEVE